MPEVQEPVLVNTKGDSETRQERRSEMSRRYRDYGDSKYADEDFTHCDYCGVKILKTEAYHCSNCQDYGCPTCAIDKGRWSDDALTCGPCAYEEED
jgi:hypothetical protein